MMSGTSRRQVIKTFVAGAAAAATSTSLLDAAFGQTGRGELALAGGGLVLVERQAPDWMGTVVDTGGERISDGTGWVVLDNGRLIGMEKGVVVDASIVSEDDPFVLHTDTGGYDQVVFVQDGSAPINQANPVWAQSPILARQAPLWEDALALRNEHGNVRALTPEVSTPEIRPEIPQVTLPRPDPTVSPPPPPPVPVPERR
jgi:hypothetical protein